MSSGRIDTKVIIEKYYAKMTHDSHANNTVTYGYAVQEEYSFLGVQPTPEGNGELVTEKDAGFTERVFLLKINIDPREHQDKFRIFRRPETASVLPPKQDVNIHGGPITMYIPVEVVRNARGELFERKIVDGCRYRFVLHSFPVSSIDPTSSPPSTKCPVRTLKWRN